MRARDAYACASEVSTPLRLPPPLRGRGGRGVSRELARMTPGEMAPNHFGASRTLLRGIRLHLASEQAAPLSPTLARKGGGSPTSPVGALRMVRQASAFGVYSGEVSTLLRLPPPLRGRVGRGVSRELARMTPGEMAPNHFGGSRTLLRGIRLHLASEQAAPLSPPLPRKGGGSSTSPVAASHDAARATPC
ncbi:hypothetical protein ACVILL_001808 [Bradyrhizobium sp. USDA 3364]